MNGSPQGANPELFDAFEPSLSAKVAPDGLNRGTPLRSVSGFSEQALRWVKKSIQISEKEFRKGLVLSSRLWGCGGAFFR